MKINKWAILIKCKVKKNCLNKINLKIKSLCKLTKWNIKMRHKIPLFQMIRLVWSSQCRNISRTFLVAVNIKQEAPPSKKSFDYNKNYCIFLNYYFGAVKNNLLNEIIYNCF